MQWIPLALQVQRPFCLLPCSAPRARLLWRTLQWSYALLQAMQGRWRKVFLGKPARIISYFCAVAKSPKILYTVCCLILVSPWTSRAYLFWRPRDIEPASLYLCTCSAISNNSRRRANTSFHVSHSFLTYSISFLLLAVPNWTSLSSSQIWLFLKEKF